LKATMYKSIEYEESIEDFVGCTWEKLLMTIVENFGGIKFHSYFWVHYSIRFGKCVQFTFYLNCILLHNSKYSTWHIYWHPKLTLNIL
jgi:hypothetical protein